MAPGRTEYSHREDKQIVKYLAGNNAWDLTNGNKIWQVMVEKGVCPNRTFHSLRNRFLRNIKGRLRTDFEDIIKGAKIPPRILREPSYPTLKTKLAVKEKNLVIFDSDSDEDMILEQNESRRESKKSYDSEEEMDVVREEEKTDQCEKSSSQPKSQPSQVAIVPPSQNVKIFQKQIVASSLITSNMVATDGWITPHSTAPSPRKMPTSQRKRMFSEYVDLFDDEVITNEDQPAQTKFLSQLRLEPLQEELPAGSQCLEKEQNKSLSPAKLSQESSPSMLSCSVRLNRLEFVTQAENQSAKNASKEGSEKLQPGLEGSDALMPGSVIENSVGVSPLRLSQGEEQCLTADRTTGKGGEDDQPAEESCDGSTPDGVDDCVTEAGIQVSASSLRAKLGTQTQNQSAKDASKEWSEQLKPALEGSDAPMQSNIIENSVGVSPVQLLQGEQQCLTMEGEGGDGQPAEKSCGGSTPDGVDDCTSQGTHVIASSSKAKPDSLRRKKKRTVGVMKNRAVGIMKFRAVGIVKYRAVSQLVIKLQRKLAVNRKKHRKLVYWLKRTLKETASADQKVAVLNAVMGVSSGGSHRSFVFLGNMIRSLSSEQREKMAPKLNQLLQHLMLLLKLYPRVTEGICRGGHCLESSATGENGPNA